MSRNVVQQIACLALAALTTLGMLGTINDFAKVENRLAAANALVAHAGAPARHA